MQHIFAKLFSEDQVEVQHKTKRIRSKRMRVVVSAFLSSFCFLPFLLQNGNSKVRILLCSAYIECSAKENRGLRHIVEEAVWILNSAVISAASELNAIDEASNGIGTSMNNAARKWSLSSSYPSKASPKHKSRKTSESISRGNR